MEPKTVNTQWLPPTVAEGSWVVWPCSGNCGIELEDAWEWGGRWECSNCATTRRAIETEREECAKLLEAKRSAVGATATMPIHQVLTIAAGLIRARGPIKLIGL